MVSSEEKRGKFIESNLGLVHSLCKRFSGRGIEYEDLYQTGCIGLIKAADAFDESRGLCFSTYAFPVIMGEIKRLFRDGGAVKVSRSLKELSLKAVREKEVLEKELGREPVISEIAVRLEVDTESVTEALCAAQPVMSLTVEGDDGVREYDLPSNDLEDELSNKLLLDCAFKNLDKLEMQIVKYRYYDGLTQSKTAERLSMTQVQVSRTEKKILKKLRNILE